MLINKKNTVNQISPDKCLPNPPQVLNATKTPKTKDKETFLFYHYYQMTFKLQLRKINRQLLLKFFSRVTH